MPLGAIDFTVESMNIVFKKASGGEIQPYVEKLGQLRIQVFADWPYLYDGDLEYEKKYLQTYVQSKKSFIFMIFDGDTLVGATTAIALTDETPEFQKPFHQKNIPISEVVYFGESILLPKYRGQGFGKRFMEERLQFAKSTEGIKTVAFCAVQRDWTDKRKPKEAKPLDEFWLSLGFQQQQDMKAEYEWKDIGETSSSKKYLKFWLKNI